MTTEQPEYLSYLLRIWRVKNGGASHPTYDGSRRPNDRTHHGNDGLYHSQAATIWRASVDSPLTGERQGFARLDDLFDFLRRQTGATVDVNRDEGVTAK